MKVARSERDTKPRTGGKRIFLTGGTGFLGSHIAAAFVKEGFEVILLARGDGRQNAAGRVARLLDWFDLDSAHSRRIRVVEGTIELPGLGLRGEDRDLLLDHAGEIIHCASSTTFSERKRPEVEAANIGGLAHVLDFAGRCGCEFFHYLSTAYAAGKKSGRCREEPAGSGEFFNVYEETKAKGEKTASDYCREKGIRLSIYRPSIVYGDSRTGRTLLFNALYFPVKTAVYLKNLLEADIRDKGGKRAGQLGVRLEENGDLFMPLRIETLGDGGINLVPVDYFVAAFMAIWDECREGGIFHIVNPAQKKIGDIIEYAKQLFHLTGMEACAAGDFDLKPKNALEVLYDSYLQTYGPYMRDRRTFEMVRAREVLVKRGIICPDFDYDIFSRCMRYAVEADWGARLFR